MNYSSRPWKWYWRINEGLEADCGVYWEKIPGQAISICRAPRYEKEEQWKNNAQLIAAAPDLLEACKQALAYLRGQPISKFDDDITILGDLKDAITKAEGRLP